MKFNLKFRNVFLLLPIIIGINFSIQAQTISLIDLYSIKDTVAVKIKIDNCTPSQKFIPTVQFYYSNGVRIPANSISLKSGNTRLKCGQSEIIQWNSIQDNIKINDKIYATVQIKTELDVNVSNHLLKSLVFPGWGDYKLRNKKHYLIYGVLGYGLLSTGFVLQNEAVKNYDLYKKSFDVNTSDNLYNKAILQKNLSYVAFATSALVWTIDLSLLTTKANRVQKNPSAEESIYYNQLANVSITGRSNTILFDNRTNYDIALENGKNLVSKADIEVLKDEDVALKLYTQSIIEFKNAISYNNTSEIANNELKNTQTKIDLIYEKRNKYNGIIKEAQNAYINGNFYAAISLYQQALDIYPKHENPKAKIKEITAIQDQQKNELNYKSLITEADNLFTEKEYDNAITFYNQALVLKPNDPYSKNQIQKIEQIQKENLYASYLNKANTAFKENNFNDALDYYEQAYAIKQSNDVELKISACNQKLIDIEYNSIIKQANIAFANDNYETALDLYQQANTIKPNQTNTINQIIICKKKLDKNDDLPSLFKTCKKAVFLIESSDYSATSQGSGFFITADGIAVTNYHVYGGTSWEKAKIYTEDGNTYSIEKVIKKDEDKDYIIFKVKNNGKVLPYVKIASKLPEIGESVFAIGNPEGLEKTLSNGIVTGYRGFLINDKDNFYIQTNTAITHGSSGGPLFNAKGEVIGITSMGKQSGSLFFAINILKLNLHNYIKK